MTKAADWEEERSCFRGVCTELAAFYAELPVAASATPKDDPSADEDRGGDDESSGKTDFIDDEAKQYVKHTVFPAVSFLLVPPKTVVDSGAVVKLANLNSLYKVFERC